MSTPPLTKRHGFRPLLLPVPANLAAPVPAAAIPAAPPNELDHAPARGGSGQSHVRLRALPAGDVMWLDANLLLDDLAAEHLEMAMGLAGLEGVVEAAPRDPSARAALRVLEARVTDLGLVRDALASIAAAAADPRLHRAFLPDAPLAEYLRGIYAWMHAIVRALDELAQGLRTLAPDWAQLRSRIEEARMFHFEELHGAIEADLLALAVVAPEARTEDLEVAVATLLGAAIALEERLDERFG